MPKEIALYVQSILSVLLLASSWHIFLFVFVRAMVEEKHDFLDSFFKRNFDFFKWFLPVYPLFFNLYGWWQIIFNQDSLYNLLMYPFIAWVAFVMLHLAHQRKLLFHCLGALLIFAILYPLMAKKLDYKAFAYPFIVWVGFVRLCLFLHKNSLFKKSFFIYMSVVWVIFVLLCFVIPQNDDYTIFLFLYLFMSWVVFLGLSLVVIAKTPFIIQYESVKRDKEGNVKQTLVKTPQK